MTQISEQPAAPPREMHPIADDIYRLSDWGSPYFTVNDEGHVVVDAGSQGQRAIDVFDVVEGLHARGLTTPLLLRFSDILAHRMKHLRDAFLAAMRENDYRGGYQCVFPIKVNQQRQVVEEVYRIGSGLDFGLEVGSKPELLAVMALTHDAPERPVICNGFKDDEYIEAVILAHKVGRSIFPVIENINELRLLIKHAETYKVRPRIGVRVKLATRGTGRWKDSAGTKAKFGLFVSEVMTVVRELSSHGMLDCLQLVHCHIGSQMQDIRTIKDAINELAHIYVELRRLGADVKCLDVGGGLGVDYDGSQSAASSSINYTLEEYAGDVVYRVARVCNWADVPHPTIVTESGRALVAHHSVLVVDVVGANVLNRHPTDAEEIRSLRAVPELPQPIGDLVDAFETINVDRFVECYHDATRAREEAMQLFNLGYMSLELRGRAERLFWSICERVRAFCRETEYDDYEMMAELDALLSDVYFCNFSVFQSLPDHWAIDQLFPIMPIHRLNEAPQRRCILADMTCDSDGKIAQFIGPDGPEPALPLHQLRNGEPYYLGVFLVGAYQETLGDIHNLFGDTHVVNLYYDTDEKHWAIEEIVRGDTAREVLGYVQFDVNELLRTMSRDCERAVRQNRLTVAESRTLLDFYESSLNGYTYLEPE